MSSSGKANCEIREEYMAGKVFYSCRRCGRVATQYKQQDMRQAMEKDCRESK